MAELLEAPLSVIGPGPALADATKGQMLIGEVDHGGVHRNPARDGAVQHLTDDGPVITEYIKGQGSFPGVDPGAGRRDGVAAQYRQDRSENLLAHDGQVRGRVDHHGGGDPAASGEGRSVVGQLQDLHPPVPRLVDHRRQPRMVPVRDNGRVVRVGGEVGIEDTGLPDHRLAKGLGTIANGQHIVRRDAGLAGIQKPAPGQGMRHAVQRYRGIDDDRGLAAEFKRDGRQVSGCRLGHRTADPR